MFYVVVIIIGIVVLAYGLKFLPFTLLAMWIYSEIAARKEPSLFQLQKELKGDCVGLKEYLNGLEQWGKLAHRSGTTAEVWSKELDRRGEEEQRLREKLARKTSEITFSHPSGGGIHRKKDGTRDLRYGKRH